MARRVLPSLLILTGSITTYAVCAAMFSSTSNTVIPNMLLLVGYTRDSRADHGRTRLGAGRTRPGDR